MESDGLKLVSISQLKQVFRPSLPEVLKSYRRILKEGVVHEPLLVERSSLTVLKGSEVLESLRLLSASKAPAILLDRSVFRVKRLKPVPKEIDLSLLLEAGIRRRLPESDFEVEVSAEIRPVNIPLSNLISIDLDRRKLRVYESSLSLLYEDWPTPLVKLRSFSGEGRSVYAKLEAFNPFSNSVKDRVAWSMIMEAIEEGQLGEILYEATSTNTGIALASIANILGRKAKLFIPKTIQKVSDIILRALGAEVMRMPVSLTVEAIGDVDALAKRDKATHLNQFENDANFKVHLKYTARELDEQLSSIGVKPDCILGGLGTSGHMSAISIYFKSKYGEDVKVVGVQPASGEVIPGIRRVESGMKWIHLAEFDEIVDVTRDEAIEGVLEVARREGLLIGLSSGAVFKAFKKIAKESGNYVLIFPDSGYKYAEQLEEYFRRHGGLEKP
ncbi:MAG: pyridoxal-phosphate dependent enzyme [Thaumarchaeota archaeon]|nr:pyridoxal-phosphate dependent enzyme [Nitrososphaerota archaeon]